jgi:dCMP deaminase
VLTKIKVIGVNMDTQSKKCAICEKKICVVSTHCRKCSRITLPSVKKTCERNKKIVDLFHDEQMSTIDIANLFNVSQIRVQQILRSANIKLHHRIYKLNESIIEKNSCEKFYILGLFAADGYVSPKGKVPFVELTLNEADRILLEDIKKIFGSDKPLYLGKDGCLKLNLYSKRIHDVMESYGICNKKSLNLKLQKSVPQDYILDFLRGYFDGNGCITGSKSADITLGFTASKEFSKQLVDLYRQIGFNVNCYEITFKKNPLFVVKKCGQKGLKILANMYARHNLFMPRKYIKFLSFVRLSVDEMMMEMAHSVAKRSTCIRRKVGCIVVNEDKTNIVAIGYNGTAKGEPNHCRSSLPGQCKCIHAEENALIKGRGTFLYCTTIPCEQCAKLIINAGIKKIFYDANYRYSYALGLFNRTKTKYSKISKNRYNWKNELANILEWKNE